METPILRTKIYIPQPQPESLIPRPVLLEKLDQGVEHRLTLISAPAGSGKTTLLSQWLNERMKAEGGRMKNQETLDFLHPSSFILHPFKVSWVSLDETDNDPVRFWTYVIAALETAGVETGENVLLLLSSPQSSLLEVALPRLKLPFSLISGWA